MRVVYNGAPTRFENLLIVGSNSAAGQRARVRRAHGRRDLGVRVRAEARRAGHETWQNDAWRDQPSVLHWPFSFTIDADRALLYASFESPGPGDHYGGDRPGDNLFGNSIVALDARTGERRWHFQTVHHDIWDYDLPAPPGCSTSRSTARRVPMLALAGKTGYLYVLESRDRRAGVRHRGAAGAAVATCRASRPSPTQPIPVKPPPLARVSYTPEDIVTAEETTAEHARVLPRAARAQRRIAQRGTVHAVPLSRAGAAPTHDAALPGLDRRRELGRHGRRSALGATCS